MIEERFEEQEDDTQKELDKKMGQKIQEVIDKNGMTQGDVADITGLSLGQINRICKGKSSPTASSLRKIASALNVPVTAFFDEYIEINSTATKLINEMPEDIVKAMGDKKKMEYLIVGLNLSDGELSPEEIKMIIEKQEELFRMRSKKK